MKGTGSRENVGGLKTHPTASTNLSQEDLPPNTNVNGMRPIVMILIEEQDVERTHEDIVNGRNLQLQLEPVSLTREEIKKQPMVTFREALVFLYLLLNSFPWNLTITEHPNHTFTGL